MENKEAILSAAAELGVVLQGDDDAACRNALIMRINDLLVNDFEKLVGILYRIDVNEKKLRLLLEERNNEDAAPIIADLIIERQIQKIDSRMRFYNDGYIDEEDKW
jgi:hypothetical protein